MKHFSKIILFVVMCLCANEAWAAEGSVIQTAVVDFGTVVISSTSSPYINLRTDGQTSSQNRCTARGYSAGALQVTTLVNLASGILTRYPTSGLVGTLTCVQDCSSGASNGVVSFKNVIVSQNAQTANVPTLQTVGGRLEFSSWKLSYTGLWEGSGNVTIRYLSGGVYHEVGTIPVNIRVRVATQLPAIVVSKTQDLNFGTISTTSAHNVTINPSSCNVSSTVPSNLISTASAKCGIFRIQNASSSAQALTSVTLPSNITLTGSNGGSFLVDVTSSPNVSTISSVGANTTLSVNVGGTLHVLGGEPAGTYTGNYTITVNY